MAVPWWIPIAVFRPRHNKAKANRVFRGGRFGHGTWRWWSSRGKKSNEMLNGEEKKESSDGVCWWEEEDDLPKPNCIV